jgi:type IV secretion system protein VirB5
MEREMKCFLRLGGALAVACIAVIGARDARAQGIPVIDAANLVQSVQQVVDDVTKIQNQVEQIKQLRDQLASISGSRNLGDVFDNPLLHNYVPPDAYTLINAVDAQGYSGLTETAKALRDKDMVYNCEDLVGSARATCETALNQPYEQKGLLQDAMTAAANRIGQINSLMSQISATTDQKSIQEMQARLGAENALLAHETTQIQMLVGMADSEERIARSRDRERQYEMLDRTGHISDYLP